MEKNPYVKPGNFFLQKFGKLTEFHFWANVMLRQLHVGASRASPAQKSQGLRVIYSKNFSRATFFVFWGTHLVDLELFARETNLEKKRSVSLSAKVKTLQPFSWFWYYNIPTCLISTIHTLIYPCYGDAWRAISQLVCTAEWVEIGYEGASLFSC